MRRPGDQLAIASPVALGNVVYCMTGFRGNAVYAIPLDAVGDITDTDKIAWHTHDSGPYVPSPLLYGDRLYFTKSSKNVISCVDAHTGKPYIDQERVPGLKDQYASPVGAAGRVYFTGRDGTTVAIRDAENLEVLATNDLGEPVDATPAIVGDEIFIRGSGTPVLHQRAVTHNRPRRSPTCHAATHVGAFSSTAPRLGRSMAWATWAS